MKTHFSRSTVRVRALVIPFLCACLLLAAAAAPGQAAPANDNLADARAIPPGDSFSISGTEVGASEEAFEMATDYPLHFVDAESGSSETVWYTWTPTVSGVMAAHITYPEFSPILGFFKAPTPDSASIVTATGIEMPDAKPANVVAGQEYLIVVSIPKGLANTFTIGATITPSSASPTPTPPPANAPTATLSVKTPKIDRAAAKVGKVFVTLSSAPASDLTLTYKLGGTAVNGTDYKMLKGSVTIPAGQTSAEIKVKPLASGGSGPVSVKLSLTAGDGYTLGGPTAGKIKIVGGQ